MLYCIYKLKERRQFEMERKCYIVEMNSALEGLFEQLNDYGFDYECDEHWPAPGYIEITVDCYPHEFPDLEDIFAPYV